MSQNAGEMKKPKKQTSTEKNVDGRNKVYSNTYKGKERNQERQKSKRGMVTDPRYVARALRETGT